ncbi:uncharacterized protein LOC117921306 isoform X2 [Vitis riparia]|uniref:uncharacterized protein LOC117921306 isoform X2 n=1 Tax=Vitis riparia TaxID=96939 RepID=UPI00155ADBEB|nr:uncharacterized protein LOC117921306 isoform X2 [Vitis riparia]
MPYKTGKHSVPSHNVLETHLFKHTNRAAQLTVLGIHIHKRSFGDSWSIRTRFDSQSMDLFSTYWVRHGQNRSESVGIEVGTGTVNAAEDRQCGHGISTANVRSDKGIECVEVSMGHFIEQVGLGIGRSTAQPSLFILQPFSIFHTKASLLPPLSSSCVLLTRFDLMATDTQKLLQENPSKTLGVDPPADSNASLKNRLQEDAPNTTIPLSPTDNPVSNVSSKEPDESKVGDSAGAADPVASSPTNTATVSDIQKKIRRAERFGMPVQLSEEEKRNSRAERFGTGPTVHGSDGSKKSEELKRKARAERFGLPLDSAPTDEESKKKARLARFASVSKTDTLEEDKKKARAIRFSNPPSDSLSQVNGKGEDIEPTAIAGKASGGA